MLYSTPDALRLSKQDWLGFASRNAVVEGIQETAVSDDLDSNGFDGALETNFAQDFLS
jgi:hypothetical protein